MEVHKTLSHGFLEPVYQEALALELAEAEIPFMKEKVLDIHYKGKLLNYLKATGKKIGLLINFGSRSLQYKRVIL